MADTIDFTGIEALTFDCYGTIVDWDGGILAAMSAVPELAALDACSLVSEREDIEKELLSGPYQPYEELLKKSLSITAARHGLELARHELDAFASTMGSWPLFPDSREALLQLQRRFQLAILSNVERRVLDRSVAALEDAGVRFAHKITADRVRSYKPARAHFDRALADLQLSPSAILHIAGSRYHDILPASRLGWRAVFVDRRSEGPSKPEDQGEERVTSLGELASQFLVSDG